MTKEQQISEYQRRIQQARDDYDSAADAFTQAHLALQNAVKDLEGSKQRMALSGDRLRILQEQYIGLLEATR